MTIAIGVGVFIAMILSLVAILLAAKAQLVPSGEVTILIGRLIPGVRHFISIPAGVSRMSVPRFTIFTFIGAFPWSLALAWAGYELSRSI